MVTLRSLGHCLHGFAIASAACVWSVTSQAATLRVSPLVVEFGSGQSATAVDLENRGTDKAALQLRAKAWTQKGAKDEFTPTDDLLISPPVVTIPPGEIQTVRLVLRKRGGTGAQAFRLFIDEIPPAGNGRPQIILALSISMPVFTMPAGDPKFAVKWHAGRTADGKLELIANNTGSTYSIISGLTASRAMGAVQTAKLEGMLPYLLPGGERRWILQGAAPATGTPMRLTIATPSGPLEATVTTP